MYTLTTNETAHYDFESFGACFEDGRYLGTWLIHAAGLRSLELRLGTEDGVSACLKKVRQVEEAMFPVDDDLVFRSRRSQYRENKNQSTRVEVGVLFHFSRKRGGGWESGSLNAYGLDHSYPGIVRHSRKPLSDAGNPSGFRFARFYLEQRRHAQALVSIFQKYPRALRTVRGIDLCTDEAGVPIWVMAPLVRWVKEAGQQAASHLRKRGEFTMPPPRLSIHAGEDFVHLLTGLRGLDHAIWRLRPVIQAEGVSPLSVCIGSDDPLVMLLLSARSCRYNRIQIPQLSTDHIITYNHVGIPLSTKMKAPREPSNRDQTFRMNTVHLQRVNLAPWQHGRL